MGVNGRDQLLPPVDYHRRTEIYAKFATQNVVEPGQKNVLPTMVDGEIVPGHFE